MAPHSFCPHYWGGAAPRIVHLRAIPIAPQLAGRNQREIQTGLGRLSVSSVRVSAPSAGSYGDPLTAGLCGELAVLLLTERREQRDSGGSGRTRTTAPRLGFSLHVIMSQPECQSLSHFQVGPQRKGLGLGQWARDMVPTTVFPAHNLQPFWQNDLTTKETTCLGCSNCHRLLTTPVQTSSRQLSNPKCSKAHSASVTLASRGASGPISISKHTSIRPPSAHPLVWDTLSAPRTRSFYFYGLSSTNSEKEKNNPPVGTYSETCPEGPGGQASSSAFLAA